MQEQVIAGILGVCPDCEQVVQLIPNAKLQKPGLRQKIEKLIKEQGLGECGQYWTVKHEYPAKGNVKAGVCYEGLCPSRLIRAT